MSAPIFILGPVYRGAFSFGANNMVDFLQTLAIIFLAVSSSWNSLAIKKIGQANILGARQRQREQEPARREREKP